MDTVSTFDSQSFCSSTEICWFGKHALYILNCCGIHCSGTTSAAMSALLWNPSFVLALENSSNLAQKSWKFPKVVMSQELIQNSTQGPQSHQAMFPISPIRIKTSQGGKLSFKKPTCRISQKFHKSVLLLWAEAENTPLTRKHRKSPSPDCMIDTADIVTVNTHKQLLSDVSQTSKLSYRDGCPFTKQL